MAARRDSLLSNDLLISLIELRLRTFVEDMTLSRKEEMESIIVHNLRSIATRLEIMSDIYTRKSSIDSNALEVENRLEWERKQGDRETSKWVGQTFFRELEIKHSKSLNSIEPKRQRRLPNETRRFTISSIRKCDASDKSWPENEFCDDQQKSNWSKLRSSDMNKSICTSVDQPMNEQKAPKAPEAWTTRSSSLYDAEGNKITFGVTPLTGLTRPSILDDKSFKVLPC